jgi:hypothetical protein
LSFSAVIKRVVVCQKEAKFSASNKIHPNQIIPFPKRETLQLCCLQSFLLGGPTSQISIFRSERPAQNEKGAM